VRRRPLAIGVALALCGGPAVAAEPVASEPVASEPIATQPVVSEPAASEPARSSSRRERLPGDRMVQAGVGVVVAGLAGYGLMAAGLAIGSQAEGDLVALAERDDIDARRDVLARGQLGNQLAIAGAITATAAMAVGIPLIVIGRRRHEAASPRAMVLVSGGAAGFGLRIRGRF
jgi:hypothetical protein